MNRSEHISKIEQVRASPHISYRFCCGLRTPDGYCISFELLLGQHQCSGEPGLDCRNRFRLGAARKERASQYETYSRRRNPSPSLTRLAKLVSAFQGCLKEPANSGQSPPRSLGPPVVSRSGFAVPRDESV
jgi:hypothetical protein